MASPVPLPRADHVPGIGYCEFGALTEAAEKPSWAGRTDVPQALKPQVSRPGIST
ncbi:hypothetical protein [Actinoplanes sp. CA-252034]|uniref:hypothetical protein n=1 Tax=Actinoplanes sp. CA-252034 TaxID=3239906 RepID=UPI003D9955AA